MESIEISRTTWLSKFRCRNSSRVVPSSRMQTFLPFACVDRSLRRLDHKRLHKQLTEAIQILRIILRAKHGEEPKYQNHPAVLMWVGHETFLRFYACRCSAIIKETTRRVKDGQPYDTRMRDATLREELGGWLDDAPLDNAPTWFGNESFHGPHRAALFRKRPDLYAEFQSDSLLFSEYYWPVRKPAEKRKTSPMTRALSVSSVGVAKRGTSKRTRMPPRSLSVQHIEK